MYVKRQIILYFFLGVVALLCLGARVVAAPCEYNPSSSSIPFLLGWSQVPISPENLCGGYYQDPLANLRYTPLPPLKTTSVQIEAGPTRFEKVGTSTLTGGVTISQTGRWVHANQAEIERDPVSGRISSGSLSDSVVLREPGKVMVGEHAHIELQSKIADFWHALYRLAISAAPGASNPAAPKELNAWGKADRIHQNSEGIIELHNATYTTCAPTVCSWQVSAEQIELNHDTGRGTARHAWLHFGRVPIFYAPYFNFPIDDRRESGFLGPSIGNSNRAGFNINLPYYWNLAPNYDATITPRIFTKRGLLMEGLFRYLTPTSVGSFNGGVLPHDHAFTTFQTQAKQDFPKSPLLGPLLNSSNNRGFFTWKNQTTFDPHWRGGVDFNYVSDSYYIQDFGNPEIFAPNQLPRNLDLKYSGKQWTFSGILQTYQTLHPINQTPVANVYSRLPQLDFNGNFPNQAYGLRYKLDNQFVYFDRAANPGEVFVPPSTGIPKAGRFNIQPGVSLPLNSLAGYITPSLQLALTNYNITNQVVTLPNSIQRGLPIFNVDSGLYFDRDTHFMHADWQQTLEPRLFYLYVPYRNQNDIPIFDTALVPFSYDSLFLTNRFSGYDRIGDANQVAFSLTTRLLNADTGVEQFRASVGEIAYFRNRQVSVCSLVPVKTPTGVVVKTVCPNPITMVGGTSPTDVISPIAGQLKYYINSSWSTTANLAWDFHRHQPVNSSLYFHYQPSPDRVFNLSYTFIRFGDPTLTTPPPAVFSHKNDFNQLGFSFAWPVKTHWNVIGSWNYNVSHAYPQTFFYGVEYDTCCWAARLVAGRAFTALNQNGLPVFNNNIYLQWQLKGLGTVGTAAPTDLLRTGIPGYYDNFQTFKGF